MCKHKINRADWVRTLAKDIVLCSSARHFTLTVTLSTQVYKWVLANLMLGFNPAIGWHPIQGGVEILLVASWYKNRDTLRRDGPLGLYADLTFFRQRRFASKRTLLIFSQISSTKVVEFKQIAFILDRRIFE